MLWLTLFAQRRPRIALLVAGMTTLVVGAGVLRLDLNMDGRALTPSNRSELRIDREIRDRFDFRDSIALLVRTDHPNGVYNAETVALLRSLTEALIDLDGVEERHVVSLATESNFRHREGSLKLQRMLESELRSELALARLREDARRIGFYHGRLISFDEKAAAIYVGTPPEADREAFYRRVLAVVAAQDPGRDTISAIGAPVAEMLLGRHILEDLGAPNWMLTPILETKAGGGSPRAWLRALGLVPLAILIMAAVFFWAYRRLAAALMPLLEAGAALLFTLGLMGWAGAPFYLTMAVMPIILTAMGVTDEIHIFHRYAGLAARPGADASAAVASAMVEMRGPIVKTSLTTAVGFLSFTLSPMAPVRVFGLFTSAGILFCMLWSLTAVPALLTLIPARRLVASASNQKQTRLGAWVGALLAWRRPAMAVAVTALALAAAAPWGIARLEVQDSWIGGFAPESGFRKAADFFDQHFLGAHILLIELDGGYRKVEALVEAGSMAANRFPLTGVLALEPERLPGTRLRIAFPEARARNSDDPRDKRQWSAYIESVERADGRLWAQTPRRSGSPLFWLDPQPEDRLRVELERRPFLTRAVLDRTAALTAFLREQPGVGGATGPVDFLETTGFMVQPDAKGSRALPATAGEIESLWSRYRFVRGEARLRQLVDERFGRALIAVYLEAANFQATARLMNAVRAYEAERLAPHGLRLRFGGDVAISQVLIDDIVTTQVRSLTLTLVGIWLAAAAMSRSWRRGFLAVLPSALAVAVNLALMGWLGMPLGVATSMFAAMTLGLGVDFAIHLLDRCRLAAARGLSGAAAIQAGLAEAGPANAVNALALALGFGALALSRTPANGRLGLLVMTGVALCALSAMVLIPALLRLFPARSADTTDSLVE